MRKFRKEHFRLTWVVLVNIILAILIIIGLGVGFSLLPIKGNYKLMAILSGSMKPSLQVGSMIIVRPVSGYNPDDVISYYVGESGQNRVITTHRIKAVDSKDGQTLYTTQGDANNIVDGQPVKPDQIIGKQIFYVPHIGYALGYLKTIPALMLLVVIPATIIIYEELKRITHETKRIHHARKERRLARQTK